MANGELVANIGVCKTVTFHEVVDDVGVRSKVAIHEAVDDDGVVIKGVVIFTRSSPLFISKNFLVCFRSAEKTSSRLGSCTRLIS